MSRPGATIAQTLRKWRNAKCVADGGIVTQPATGVRRVRSVAWLSRVGYSTDGASAAVYFRFVCGGSCGGERLVVLSKTTGSRWLIQPSPDIVVY